MHRLKKMLINY